MGVSASTEYYRRNPEKYAERLLVIRARQHRIRKRIQEYRKDKVCSICGYSDYRAIDFHHRNADEKELSISNIHKLGWSWERTQAELDKCDPVCKNCHAILHHPDKPM